MPFREAMMQSYEVLWSGEVVGTFFPNFADNMRYLGNWRSANTPASERFVKAVEEYAARLAAVAPVVTVASGRWYVTRLFQSPQGQVCNFGAGQL